MNIRLSKWKQPDLRSNPGAYGDWNDRVDHLVKHCLYHSKDKHSQRLFRLLYAAYPIVASKYDEGVLAKERKRQSNISKNLSGEKFNYQFVSDSANLGMELPKITTPDMYCYHKHANDLLGTKCIQDAPFFRHAYPNSILSNHSVAPLAQFYKNCNVAIVVGDRREFGFLCCLLKDEDGLPVVEVEDVVKFYLDFVVPSRGTVYDLSTTKRIGVNGDKWFKDIQNYDFVDTSPVEIIDGKATKMRNLFDRINLIFYL